jgi:hypothetical protein
VDALVSKPLTAFIVPEIAVAIIKKTEKCLPRVRVNHRKQRKDAIDLVSFLTAKSFTSASLATEVDEGKNKMG